jgi:hypothetical protein
LFPVPADQLRSAVSATDALECLLGRVPELADALRKEGVKPTIKDRTGQTGAKILANVGDLWQVGPQGRPACRHSSSSVFVGRDNVWTSRDENQRA